MKTVGAAKIEKKANTVVGYSVICNYPEKADGYGRILSIDGLNCAFCTKYFGGCHL
jgi:hypothetical protein